MERYVMIARLKPDARERVRELIAQRDESLSTEFDRQAIFLAEGEIVFFFEGPDAAATVRSILNDPARSTVIAPWLPLFDGPLHAAPEAYYWEHG
jgi:hypothetical protein